MCIRDSSRILEDKSLISTLVQGRGTDVRGKGVLHSHGPAYLQPRYSTLPVLGLHFPAVLFVTAGETAWADGLYTALTWPCVLEIIMGAIWRSLYTSMLRLCLYPRTATVSRANSLHRVSVSDPWGGGGRHFGLPLGLPAFLVWYTDWFFPIKCTILHFSGGVSHHLTLSFILLNRSAYIQCLKKRPPFSYDCSVYKCWPISIIFVTKYILS